MPAPNAENPRFVILAAIDESPLSERVIAQAVSSARSVPRCEIHLVYVAHPVEAADVSNEPREAFLARHRETLQRRARETRSAFGGTVVGHLEEGYTAQAIAQMASSIDAGLIVVGLGEHRSIERRIVGSVAMSVIERSACPVVVVRAKAHEAAHAPEIEPPCPSCLETQRASGGARLWCARHAEHHPHAHLHYEIPEGFGAGSSLVQASD